MARPVKIRGAGIGRVMARVTVLGLAAAVATACTFAGRAVAPTPEPPRLLDPTAPVVPLPTGAVVMPTGMAAPKPAGSAPVAEPTVQIVGVVESISGTLWVVEGTRIRVEPEVAPPGLGVGSLVRVTARVYTDDREDPFEAVRIELLSEVPLAGAITAIEPTRITIEGRVIMIPPGVVIPAGLAPGTIVRVVVDDDDGTLVLRLIEPLPEARVVGGVVELIDDDDVVIGGQRLRLGAEVVLWRVRLVVGEPVRLIVVPVGGTLTIIAITVVTVVVPPPVVVMPVPTAVIVQPPPVIVQPPPRPAPPSNSGSDDDDDDDDD